MNSSFMYLQSEIDELNCQINDLTEFVSGNNKQGVIDKI